MLVSGQVANDGLYRHLIARENTPRVVQIGDALAPGTIAAAVYSGHKFGRDLGLANPDVVPFLREDVALSPDLNGYDTPALAKAGE